MFNQKKGGKWLSDGCNTCGAGVEAHIMEKVATSHMRHPVS